MPIERVGVIGAGTMGNGIAHVFARSGYRVTLCDVEQRFLDRGLETIGKNLDRELAKGKITGGRQSGGAEADCARARPRATCDLRFRDRSGHGEIRNQGGNLSRPRPDLPSGSDSGFEYVFHFDHQAWRRDPASGKNYRNAFLQSGAGDETGGSDSRAGHFAGNIRDGARSGVASSTRRPSK